MRPHVELHIGELVLEGLPAKDRYRIAAAVEHGLTRLLSEPAVGGLRNQNVDLAPVAQLTLNPVATPEAMGNQIATAVFRQSLLQGENR